MRKMMHTGLVGAIRSILKDVGIPDLAIVTEARGLRSEDATKLGDVVVPDFFAEGKHMVIDTVVTTVYRNTAFLRQVASIPGYAAKQAEDRKFYANKTCTQPIVAVHGGHHVLVHFAVEGGGRLALLRAMSTVAM